MDYHKFRDLSKLMLSRGYPGKGYWQEYKAMAMIAVLPPLPKS
jgi:hypothetical protein